MLSVTLLFVLLVTVLFVLLVTVLFVLCVNRRVDAESELVGTVRDEMVLSVAFKLGKVREEVLILREAEGTGDAGDNADVCGCRRCCCA